MRQVITRRRGGPIELDNTFVELTDVPSAITAHGVVRGDSAGTALEFYSPTAEEKEAVDGALALTADTVELFGIRNASAAAKTITVLTDPSVFHAGRRLVVRVRTNNGTPATVTLTDMATGNGQLRLGDAFASATAAPTHDHAGAVAADGAHDHQDPSAPANITVVANQIWLFDFMALDVTETGDPMSATPNGWELIAPPVRVH